MIYNIDTTNPKPSTQKDFDHKSLPTPAWFKPFWDEFMRQEKLDIKSRFDYCREIEKLYQEFCECFNAHEKINTDDKRQLHIIYAQTICKLADVLKLDYHKRRHNFNPHWEVGIKIAELQDFEFITEILKAKWCYFVKGTHVFRHYMHVMIKQNNFNADDFFDKFSGFFKRLRNNDAYDHNFSHPSHHVRTGLWGTNIGQVNDISEFALGCLEDVFDGLTKDYLDVDAKEACEMADLLELPISVKCYFYNLLLAEAIEHDDFSTADFVYALLPADQIAIKSNPPIHTGAGRPLNHGEYQGSRHQKFNRYLYSKDPTTERLYAWAIELEKWPEQTKIMVQAALAGHVLACDHIIGNGAWHMKHDNPEHVMTETELISILNKCLEMQHKDGIKLLAMFYLVGMFVSEDVPRAIRLFESIKNYAKIANIYRYHSPQIHNEFEAFKYYQLADVQKKTEETSLEIAASYLHGLGTQQDILKALEMYKDLSQNMSSRAAYKVLGDIYSTGFGGVISADLTAAREYYTLAGERFNAVYCAFSSTMNNLLGRGRNASTRDESESRPSSPLRLKLE